ncbi:MAG: ubiquitin-conjugating enzyme E2 [Candidatus Methanofastidiosia archaeon]
MLRLPDDVFWPRLKQEIEEVACHEDFKVEKMNDLEFVITIKAKGYEPSQNKNEAPKKKDVHKVRIYVPREYPYAAPRLNWLTSILHSNICPPDEEYHGIKGFVCIEGLNYYKPFSLNLVSLCESIRNIIENPNPASTIPTSTPKKASEFFRKNMSALRDEPIIYLSESGPSSESLPRLIRR